MATYAIGDLQGCRASLEALLDTIRFDRARDRLWFVGDLVNRGPDSLGALRFVHSLDACSVTVLGNHDLHLLALRHDPARKMKKGDTLEDILTAPDRDLLLDWLRQRPLLHHDPALGVAMVHAGLPPQWDIAEAAAHARELEAALRAPDFEHFLHEMYGNAPDAWADDLSGTARLRYLTNAFTRMRYLRPDGRLELKTKVGLETPTPGLLPWFMLPDRRSAGTRIVFGHWSTLRLDAARERRFNVVPLDTGAVWGGELTALRLDDGTRFSVPGVDDTGLSED
ncbi:MAG: symmetrical bis(5'-nucleosyl)-tetraphosphatase [Gammaproteobacteria bacterium]